MTISFVNYDLSSSRSLGEAFANLFGETLPKQIHNAEVTFPYSIIPTAVGMVAHIFTATMVERSTGTGKDKKTHISQQENGEKMPLTYMYMYM